METSARKFLSARWLNLALFNYEVDPAVLQKHIPAFTEIDYWEGKAVVSIVGFLFHDTRVAGVKWPLHTHFEEVNLRYYIKRFDGKQWRRGVGFVSEIVPKPMIALLANTLYNEKYSTAAMGHELGGDELTKTVAYDWQKKGQERNTLFVRADAALSEIGVGSQEEFILEHYFGYNEINPRATVEYQVHHPRWQVHQVRDHQLHCDAARLYGADFAPFITRQYLLSVHLAQGSDVWVQFPTIIRSGNKP